MFTCTWPRSKHLGPESVLYRDEIWTGIEYQVAGHLAWEGMLTEALAICRGVHERYHPAKQNPWNEVECGDHYARAMASHGVFLGLCGFEYHGPRGHLGFAPRLQPEDFRAAFTTAEGWGTLRQQIGPKAQKAEIELKWGRLRLNTVSLDLNEQVEPSGVRVRVAGKRIEANLKRDGGRLTVQFGREVVLAAGQKAEITLEL